MGGFAVSTTILAFITTFGGEFFIPAAIILMLEVSGIVGSQLFGTLEEDEDIDEGEAVQLGIFATVALGAFLIYNLLIPQLKFTASTVSVTTFFSVYTLPITGFAAISGAAVFTVVCVPNGEEQFFRGFWGNLAAKYLPPGAAEAVGGSIFMLFHIAVYGLNPYTLGIIFSAGFTFMFVDIATKRLSTSILAHMANNGLSFLVGGSVLTVLVPGLQVPTLAVELVPMIVPAFFAVRLWRAGRLNIFKLGRFGMRR